MFKPYILLFPALLFSLLVSGQNLTDETRISLITCGPGDDLYATFGHSAIHVYDERSGIDKVYNYGTFDFDTPNFYMKFARGKLLYRLDVTSFERFVRTYQYEGRWVFRQDLNLSVAQKNALFGFLENNAKPENRNYKYDFFYDNCSTRIRDAIEDVLGDSLVYPIPPDEQEKTFRNFLDMYLTNHPWSDLGIDLALGAPCDRVARWRDQMFLPDYLMSHMDTSLVLVNGEKAPLVHTSGYILESRRESSTESESVVWLFWVLFVLIGVGGFFVKNERFRWVDIAFFSLIGILGIFIALLWFATDHSATKWNFNLLWATPTWIYGTVLLWRKKTASRFFKGHAIFMFAIVVFWMLIPQDFHMAVVPIILTLAARSWAWQQHRFLVKENSQ
ncbi:MAG TPA: DUF4105 domain-containing protein [Cryomorphaceae bacterium]|nr:DUF4105 domain-containing protein [Cryomorphaceae bacterium]